MIRKKVTKEDQTGIRLSRKAVSSYSKAPYDFFVGGQRVFYPNQLPNLSFWIKADSITGLANNAPVATWNDLSGNNNHVSQGTAGARPLYKTNIKNGLPAVFFDGVDDTLFNNAATNLPNSQRITAFYVFSIFATATEYIILDLRSNGNGNTILGNIGQHFISLTDNQFFLLHRDNGNGGTPQVIATPQFTGWRLAEVTWDGTTGSLYLNGTLIGSLAFPQTVSGLDFIRLGCNFEGIGKFFKDYIAEVLIYRDFKSVSERALLREYLRTKWAIY